MENIKISPSLTLEIRMLLANKVEDLTTIENCMIKFDHDENNEKIMSFKGFINYFFF